jgi:hypothetical protein
MLVLSGLRWFEAQRKQEQHATLNLTTERDLPARKVRSATTERAGYEIKAASAAYSNQTRQRELELSLQWKVSPEDLDPPPFLLQRSSDPNVLAAHGEATRSPLLDVPDPCIQ